MSNPTIYALNFDCISTAGCTMFSIVSEDEYKIKITALGVNFEGTEYIENSNGNEIEIRANEDKLHADHIDLMIEMLESLKEFATK